MDPSSFSRPDLVKSTHINLDLNVNFNKRILVGTVELDAEKVDPNAKEIILDTLKLNIISVYDVDTKEKLDYQVGEHISKFGSKLTIQLPQKNENRFKIGIAYETSTEASGLQWLSPENTAGKKHPYIYTQFESIHARSALPCQDTPGVKTPYNATISAPQEFTVLMSALRVGTKLLGANKKSFFHQKVPVPSYLIALAVGMLESRKIGPRSTVWSEKELIEKCAYEFSETEHQLKTAEELCGPYVWGKYDLLVLPPSFPYGGMENPCLTFVTPSLITGDRSLANVVAHEIAHSWTGNLVTNRNFEHFWVNEGFTMFIERKIKSKLESPQSGDFDAFTHLSELREDVHEFGETNPLTALVIDLEGVHPDDVFSTIPYEKGYTFLRYLESVIGGPTEMEPFLRSYFEKFKYQSIDTMDVKNYFETYFAHKPAIKKIDWKAWLSTPGMPLLIPNYDKTLANICDQLFDKYINWNGDNKIPITNENALNLIAYQVMYLLQKILDIKPQPIKKLQGLNDIFKFDNNNNVEILFLWNRICIKAHWKDKIDAVFLWLNSVGRMKYVKPVYKELYKWEFTRKRAIENFKTNRKNMMQVSATSIERELNINV